MTLFHVAALSFSLASFAAAQVSPAYFVNASGNDALAPLSGLSTLAGTRHLQMHGDLTAGTTIREIAFRPAPSVANGLSLTARTVVLTLRISHAATTTAAPDPTFLNNHGPDLQVPIATQQITFAPHVTGLPLPRPFSDAIVLPTPFVYNGTAPLCWDVEVFNVGNQRIVPYDAFSSPASNPPARVTTFEGGCVSTGALLGQPFRLDFIASISWIGQGGLQLVVGSGPQLASGAYLFGLPLLNLTLPGTDIGTSGPCLLRTTPFVSAPFFLPGSGSTGTLIPVTVGTNLHGVSVTVQAAAIDAGANSLGIVTTNAAVMNLTAPFGALPISSVAGVAGQVFGNANPGEGAIVEFR